MKRTANKDFADHAADLAGLIGYVVREHAGTIITVILLALPLYFVGNAAMTASNDVKAVYQIR